MKLTELDGLILARALIEDISDWCQGSFARDAHGEKEYPDSPKACQYCAIGACIAAGTSAIPLQIVVSDAFPQVGSVQELNDVYCRERSHRCVLETFDRAIDKLIFKV